MKIATLDDLPEIVEMAMKFLETSGYERYSDEQTITNLGHTILTGKQDTMIILLEPGVGMIAGMVSPFVFGPHLIASELAWWINPEHRGKKVGDELVSAFEYWAKHKAGCKMITLTSLDDSVGRYYEKKGYKLYERAYMKEL